jgi:hypothetical protein
MYSQTFHQTPDGSVGKPPRESDSNHETSSLLIQWLKSYTGFSLQWFTQKSTQKSHQSRTLFRGTKVTFKEQAAAHSTGSLQQNQDTREWKLRLGSESRRNEAWCSSTGKSIGEARAEWIQGCTRRSPRSRARRTKTGQQQPCARTASRAGRTKCALRQGKSIWRTGEQNLRPTDQRPKKPARSSSRAEIIEPGPEKNASLERRMRYNED